MNRRRGALLATTRQVRYGILRVMEKREIEVNIQRKSKIPTPFSLEGCLPPRSRSDRTRQNSASGVELGRTRVQATRGLSTIAECHDAASPLAKCATNKVEPCSSTASLMSTRPCRRRKKSALSGAKTSIQERKVLISTLLGQEVISPPLTSLGLKEKSAIADDLPSAQRTNLSKQRNRW